MSQETQISLFNLESLEVLLHVAFVGAAAPENVCGLFVVQSGVSEHFSDAEV